MLAVDFGVFIGIGDRSSEGTCFVVEIDPTAPDKQFLWSGGLTRNDLGGKHLRPSLMRNVGGRQGLAEGNRHGQGAASLM
jgi:hypothetical protein